MRGCRSGAGPEAQCPGPVGSEDGSAARPLRGRAPPHHAVRTRAGAGAAVVCRPCPCGGIDLQPLAHSCVCLSLMFARREEKEERGRAAAASRVPPHRAWPAPRSPRPVARLGPCLFIRLFVCFNYAPRGGAAPGAVPRFHPRSHLFEAASQRSCSPPRAPLWPPRGPGCRRDAGLARRICPS